MNRGTAVAIAVAVSAAPAISVPAARATYAGKRGPIVFQRLLNPMDESTTQLFALSPTTGQVRQLTHFQGGAFDPDYSPNGRQIAFDRRFQGRPGRGLHNWLRRLQPNSDSNCLLWPVPRHRRTQLGP